MFGALKIGGCCNGGTSWTPQSSGVTQTLNGVWFTDANTGTVVGPSTASGTILRTTDGGNTWTPQSSGIPFTALHAVCFVDVNNGWAAGESGAVIHTTNGGSNWTEQTSGTTVSLYDIFFSDLNNGTAVGQLGTILRTTDGGTTWTKQVSRTSTSLKAVYFTSTYTGTVVGEFGTILHTTTGGVVGVKEIPQPEIPREFMLSQNYSNPFNPSTKIDYSVKERGYVQLIVYDILGKEIATLVSEVKSPGEYSVTFSGNGLPSGVYIYSLRINGLAENRKMILLR